MINDSCLLQTSSRSVEDLFLAMRRIVTHYPEHVEEIREPFLTGTAFFPGGYGTWRDHPDAPAPALPIDDVVFIGHNFDGTQSKASTNVTNNHIDELDTRTWKGMKRMFEDLGDRIDRRKCFFTNALMGKRVGKPMGRARFDRHYHPQCLELLKTQIAWTRPRVVVALGSHTISHFRRASPEIVEAWNDDDTLKSIYQRNASVLRVSFGGCNRVCVVALIPHAMAWAPIEKKGMPAHDLRCLQILRALDAAWFLQVEGAVRRDVPSADIEVVDLHTTTFASGHAGVVLRVADRSAILSPSLDRGRERWHAARVQQRDARSSVVGKSSVQETANAISQLLHWTRTRIPLHPERRDGDQVGPERLRNP